jgi:hypothetical protein
MSTDSTAPAQTVIVVTPSDSADLASPCRAIRVAGAGNVQITTAKGDKVVCAFLAGETRPLAATRIWSTNTTATTIEAMT